MLFLGKGSIVEIISEIHLQEMEKNILIIQKKRFSKKISGNTRQMDQFL